MTPAPLSRRVERRLAEVLATHGAPAEATSPLRALLHLWAEDPHAPTAVTEPWAAVDVHIADALSALALEPVRRAVRAVDVGSGAGIPGLVLAAALPDMGLAAVESARRKAEFLATAVELAGLRDRVEVVAERAESWSAGMDAHDAVFVRAVASLAVVVEYAAPLLALDGHVIAWKGRRDPDEEAAGLRAASELGLELTEIRRVAPQPGADERHLLVLRKVAPTPARYPRRPGMARKRPLGAGFAGNAAPRNAESA